MVAAGCSGIREIYLLSCLLSKYNLNSYDGICSLSIDDINCNIITASLKYWEESIGLKIDDDDNEEIRLKEALPKLANGWKKYNIGQGLVIHTNAHPGVFDDLKKWLPFYGIDF